jgi:hypothetical protein
MSATPFSICEREARSQPRVLSLGRDGKNLLRTGEICTGLAEMGQRGKRTARHFGCVEGQSRRRDDSGDSLCPGLIIRASSSGRRDTIQCADSALLLREKHLFGCTQPKPSQGIVPAGRSPARDFGFCFQCKVRSSSVLRRPVETAREIVHVVLARAIRLPHLPVASSPEWPVAKALTGIHRFGTPARSRHAKCVRGEPHSQQVR